jgi:hypothetical protein
LGNEEEREKTKRWWYQMRREAWKKMDIFKISSLPVAEEEITEERNDVYIYKTLRYPPKSTPPTAT